METEDLLTMLESLLSITEEFKPIMNSDALREWSRISAKTADYRESPDGEYEV